MDTNFDLNYIRHAYKVIGFTDQEVDRYMQEYNDLILAKFISILAERDVLTESDASKIKDVSELNDLVKDKIDNGMVNELIEYIQELNISIFKIIGEEATEEEKTEIVKYLDLYKQSVDKAYQSIE